MCECVLKLSLNSIQNLYVCLKTSVNGSRYCCVVEFSSSVDQFLTRCDLSCLMQDFIGSYIMMEEYFMRMMVIKVSFECKVVGYAMINILWSVGNKSAFYDVINVMNFVKCRG